MSRRSSRRHHRDSRRAETGGRPRRVPHVPIPSRCTAARPDPARGREPAGVRLGVARGDARDGTAPILARRSSDPDTRGDCRGRSVLDAGRRQPQTPAVRGDLFEVHRADVTPLDGIGDMGEAHRSLLGRQRLQVGDPVPVRGLVSSHEERLGGSGADGRRVQERRPEGLVSFAEQEPPERDVDEARRDLGVVWNPQRRRQGFAAREHKGKNTTVFVPPHAGPSAGRSPARAGGCVGSRPSRPVPCAASEPPSCRCGNSRAGARRQLGRQ